MDQNNGAVRAVNDRRALLDDPAALRAHISRRLFAISRKDERTDRYAIRKGEAPSSVLLLLGRQNGGEPCLILNKRSARVRQPGDICCPGGGITPLLDAALSKLLSLPGLPLARWPYWNRWNGEGRPNGRGMPLLLATGLREGFEEMRLNPLRFRFLGPMPPHCLRVFRRKIYPMVGWVYRQRRFRPNWEVDRIVRIPLKDFWEKKRYAVYRVSFSRSVEERFHRKSDDFPCFMFETDGHREVLWGVTYRIVMNFMASVLDVSAPDAGSLPVISGRLKGSYITGK